MDDRGHGTVPADCAVPEESEPLASAEMDEQRGKALA